MEPIKEKYLDIALEMVKHSVQASNIRPDAVFQTANKTSRKILNRIIEDLLLPDSSVEGYDKLIKLHALAKEGKSCLILMEHYSNFDLPNLFFLLEKNYPGGEEIEDDVISMAGMKLNVESEFVKAFTESFTRIVIYPSRSLAALEGTDSFEQEQKISRKINMAALHEMVRQKHAGKIILLFPSGTRYRPGDESTKKGLAEVDSYLKSFDYFIPIGIAGNTLHINTEGSMSEDFVNEDTMVFKTGEVTDAREWRKRVRESAGPAPDVKQFVADEVMSLLDQLHREAETIRQERLARH